MRHLSGPAQEAAGNPAAKSLESTTGAGAAFLMEGIIPAMMMRRQATIRGEVAEPAEGDRLLSD